MDYAAWLTLAHAWTTTCEYRALCERFGDATTIVAQPASRLQDAGLSGKKATAIAAPDSRLLKTALDWLDHENHHLVVCDDGCPDLLQEIPGPPLLLYVNGDVDALHLPSLAIIGSRNPTAGGVRNALDFARHLGGCGFAITSGLAQGIDTAAHRGALDAGAKTIAFLGHGIDRVYPAQNRDLAHEIVASGALVTEYPPGTPPDKRHFPERNRLISGLSVGTLVIEAARRSGTLITARLAADQGREVFALPGSIHNPLSRGCHALIRQGAKLVETGADILAELAPLAGHLQSRLADEPALESGAEDLHVADDDYDRLRAALSHDPVSLDELESQSGLTIDTLSSMLLILELHGEVESMSGGRYALTARA